MLLAGPRPAQHWCLCFHAIPALVPCFPLGAVIQPAQTPEGVQLSARCQCISFYLNILQAE